MTNSKDKNPLPKLTTEILLSKPEDVPKFEDTPETRAEGARYLAGRLDDIVGEDKELTELIASGFYPEGTTYAHSDNLILGDINYRTGYRPYNGKFDVTRLTIPGKGVTYEVNARRRFNGGGSFERGMRMTLNSEGQVDLTVTRQEKTGDESQPGTLVDLSDIDDYIDGTTGELVPIDRDKEEVVYSGDYSQALIVNKSRMRKFANAVGLGRLYTNLTMR